MGYSYIEELEREAGIIEAERGEKPFAPSEYDEAIKRGNECYIDLICAKNQLKVQKKKVKKLKKKNRELEKRLKKREHEIEQLKSEGREAIAIMQAQYRCRLMELVAAMPYDDQRKEIIDTCAKDLGQYIADGGKEEKGYAKLR